MKHFSFKAAIAVILATLMTFAVFPVSALPAIEAADGGARNWTVPAGYNENDYNKCVEFLEQPDWSGSTKLGYILDANYDPNDPSTWGTAECREEVWLNENGSYTMSYDDQEAPCFMWEQIDGEYRLVSLELDHVSSEGIEYFPEYDYETDPILLNLDLSGCTELTYLNIGNRRISIDGELTLTDCSSLAFLDCGIGSLKTLDVSTCSSLNILFAGCGALSQLVLGNNASLEILECWENRLSTLDLSGLTSLVYLNCSMNKIKKLDVSALPALKRLDCSENFIKSLDVSGCPLLNYFDCSSNPLKMPDISNNTELRHFAYDGLISDLDLTGHPNLPISRIKAEGNGYVASIFLPSYGYVYIMALVGEGEEFLGFYDENGELIDEGSEGRYPGNEDYWDEGGDGDYDIWDIFADDQRAKYYFATYDDPWFSTVIARFSGESSQITVPDGYNENDYLKCVEFLEQTDEFGNKNGLKLDANYDPNDPTTWGTVDQQTYSAFIDGDWQLFTEYSDAPCFNWEQIGGEYRLVSVDLRYISSIGCWESYSNESELCGSLDLSGCTELTRISCGYGNGRSCNIDELIVDGCSELAFIACMSRLTDLDISGLPKLTELWFASNRIYGELALSSSTLKVLNCDSCGLTGLDLSGLPALEYLDCHMNFELCELDLSHTPQLLHLDFWGNSIAQIDLSGVPALRYLDCRDNELTELDVSCCPDLVKLDCCDNPLESLDLSCNPEMNDLDCNFAVSDLDLSACTKLPVDRIAVQGNGTVNYVSISGDRNEYYSETEYEYYSASFFLHAIPNEGEEFLGFYDENGELIFEGEEVTEWEYQFIDDEWVEIEIVYYMLDSFNSYGTVFARFSGYVEPTPGDIDGDGEVNTMDALVLLRYVMELPDSDDIIIENSDVNNDGVIDLYDVLLVLRMALDS